MAGEKEACPECDKKYAPVYLSEHKRKAHGIYGGKTGRIRKKGMPKQTQAVEVFKAIKPAALKFKVLPFIVLEDQDGVMWLAERMER